MASTSYDSGTLGKTLRGMSDGELRKFWWDVLIHHSAPYPRYIRAILKASRKEMLRRAREKYCPVSKLRRVMKPRQVAIAS